MAAIMYSGDLMGDVVKEDNGVNVRAREATHVVLSASEQATVLLNGGTCVPGGNLGDALMLQVVLERLPTPGDGCRLVSRASADSFVGRAKCGLHQLLWKSEWRRPIRSATGMALRRYRERFGIVAEDELDAVLDFNGFRYGEIGYRQTLDASRETSRWKKQNTRIIFLPQAFGPFNSPRLKEAMRRIAENSCLLCPRDPESEKYLREIVKDASKILRAPDITIPVLPAKSQVAKPWAAIIPNIWMVERTEPAMSGRYVEFLAAGARLAMGHGLIPRIVLHSPAVDRRLLDAIRRAIGEDIEVVAESDPMRMKGVIGRCSLAIGARYHGLVAAMSQGVPTIGTSWSHKYQWLFEDFGCPEALVRPDIDGAAFERLVSRLLTNSPVVQSRLLENGERLGRVVESMWDRVRACLSGVGSRC